MGARLSEAFVERAASELRAAGIDGWLLYDFRGRNPMAADLLGMPEGQKRRFFVMLSPDAPPAALVHRIELSGWSDWSGPIETYVGWEEMEAKLGRLLAGRDTVAMEVSERDAVPYVDNVPAGVLELVESLGGRVTSSVDLISRTVAQWGPRGRDLHRRAAEILARTARAAFDLAARAASGEAEDGVPATEHALAEWVRVRLRGAGLIGADTIVAVGANAAKPHYEPEVEGSAPLRAGEVFLIDLWGRFLEPAAVYADQTWMGWLGPEPPGDVQAAWEAARDARDAAVDRIRRAGDDLPTGADVDRAARAVLIERGYEDAIYHRTGHAIDRDLHGVGPNIDSVETRDERKLVPGVGFSIEPGLYFEGRFGVRTEIDVFVCDDGPEVSPDEVQQELWLP